MKKKTQIYLSLCSLLLLLVGVITSCANPVESKVEQVTITYVNGENVTSKVQEKKTVIKGYKLTQEDLPPFNVIEYYQDDGWYNKDVKAKIGDVVSENITLTSKAILPNVTINYVNGENVTSKVPESITVSRGHTLTAKELPSLTVSEYYQDDGWYNKDVKAKIGDVVTENITLTSKAILPDVTINYVNGENVTSKVPESITVSRGHTLTAKELPSLTVSEYYQDDGWYNKDVKAKIGDVVTENITLTSKAILPDVTITYVNGENVTSKVPESITVSRGHTLTAKELPSLTVSGYYEDDGWYNKTVKAKIGDVVSENITLTSKAILPDVTITYVKGVNVNSEAPISKTVKKGYTLTADDLPKINPNDGYVEDGWYNGTKQFKSGDVILNDTKLTSKVKKLCTISYLSSWYIEGIPETRKQVTEGYKLTEDDLPTVTTSYPNIIVEGGWQIGNDKVTVGTVINDDVSLQPSVHLSDIDIKQDFTNLGINDSIKNNFDFTIYYTLDGSAPDRTSNRINNGAYITIQQIVNSVNGDFEKLNNYNQIKFVAAITGEINIYSNIVEKPFSIGIYDITFGNTGISTKIIKDDSINLNNPAKLEAEKKLNANTEQGKSIVSWKFNNTEIVGVIDLNKPVISITKDMTLEPEIGYKRIRISFYFNDGHVNKPSFNIENSSLNDAFGWNASNIKGWIIDGQSEILPGDMLVSDLIIKLDKNRDLKNGSEIKLIAQYNQ